MTYEENLNIIRKQGMADALALREASPEMTGTELIDEERKIPPFDPKKDYAKWPVGAPVADEGQVWLLLIPHNAANHVGRPANLRAMWGLAHTTDPAKAKPWVAPYGTSGLYMAGECCTYPYPDGTTHVLRDLYDNNDYPPLTLNAEDRWEDLGEVVTV